MKTEFYSPEQATALRIRSEATALLGMLEAFKHDHPDVDVAGAVDAVERAGEVLGHFIADALIDEVSWAQEEWMPVTEFPRYEVSNMGRVRSLGAAAGLRKVPRIKKPRYDKDGYLIVSLCTGEMSKTKTRRVSRLVLTAFKGPPPKGHEAAHENGIRDDDRLSNLSWKTPVDNMADKVRHLTLVRGSLCYNAQIDERLAATIKRIDAPHGDIAKQFGVSKALVQQLKSGRTWKHVQ